MHVRPFVGACYVSAVIGQSLFINSLPEYSVLPACAERPLSTIVRDMNDGCGDNQQTTSYSCFCTDSSSYFASAISTKVASSCLPDITTAVSQALDVFGIYCALGANSTISSAASRTPTSTTKTGASDTMSQSSAATPGTSTSHASLPALPTETTSTGGRSQSLTLRLFLFSTAFAGALQVFS